MNRVMYTGWLFVGGLWLVLSQPLVAQEGTEEINVAALIQQLGDISYERRLSAYHQLIQAGEAAREEVEVATHSPDCEVRRQAERIRGQIMADQLWQGSLVCFDQSQLSASQALRQLSEQTGNQIWINQDDFDDATIYPPVTPTLFWKALDTICQHTDNILDPGKQSKDLLRVARGTPDQSPVAYFGPVRATITNARHTFTEEIDYATGHHAITNSMQMEISVAVEPSVHLLAYNVDPIMVEAITDQGTLVELAQLGDATWKRINCLPILFDLRLDGLTADTKKLASLRVKIRLLAVFDHQHLRIENPQAEQSFRQEDVELVVIKWPQEPGRSHNIMVEVKRFIPLELRPIASEIEGESILHEIVVKEENAFEFFGQGGPISAWPCSEEPCFTEEGLAYSFQLWSGEKDVLPTGLSLTYPRLRDEEEIELLFTDVPLPSQNP